MNKYNIELTEEELLMVLTYRDENKSREDIKKEKNLLRKYFFNKCGLIDMRTALIREAIKLIFTIYILEKFISK